MTNELEEALESLGHALRATRGFSNASQVHIVKNWYCENCGVVVQLNIRCRMCGKSEEDLK